MNRSPPPPQTSPAADPSSRWLVAIVVASVLAFAPALFGDFIWDDAIIFMFAGRSVGSFWFSTNQPDYWPVTYTVLWALRNVFHGATWGFHLANLLVHATNVWLWWRVLGRLGAGRWRVAAVMLFALHPMQVESVAYIFQIKTTLSLTFFLLALEAYVRAFDERRVGSLVVALIAFALACLTKTAAVMLPAALVLFHVSRRTSWQVASLRLLPFVAVGAATAIVTVKMSAANAHGVLIWKAGLAERVLTAAYNGWFYVGKFLLPVGLTVAYPKVSMPPSAPASYLGFALWALVLGAAWVLRRRFNPWSAAGVAFYIFQIAPVLGLVNIFFMKWSLVADHWAYVALMGLAVAASAVLDPLIQDRSTRRLVVIGVAAVLFVLSARHSRVFRSADALWESTLATNPKADIALTSLGHQFFSKKDFGRALERYQQAAKVNPDNDEAQFGVAISFVELGRRAEATPFLRRTLELNPDHARANNELGLSALEAKQYVEAERYLRRATELSPTLVEPYGNLALVYRELGKLDLAVAPQLAASRLAPNDDRVLVNLGGLFIDLRRYKEAEPPLRRALEVNPKQAMAHFNLGRLYQQQGDVPRAIAAYEAGLLLQPENLAAQKELGTLKGPSLP